jgi:hypothetical protein
LQEALIFRVTGKIIFEQAKFCAGKPNLSQREVLGRDLVLDVTVGSGWCVNRYHVGITHIFTLLKARLSVHKATARFGLL